MMYGNEPVNVIVNPLTKEVANSGLTKREYFAATAMQGILSNTSDWANCDHGLMWVSESSVKYADALIEALNKTK